jgi:hypothetical protein
MVLHLARLSRYFARLFHTCMMERMPWNSQEEAATCKTVTQLERWPSNLRDCSITCKIIPKKKLQLSWNLQDHLAQEWPATCKIVSLQRKPWCQPLLLRGGAVQGGSLKFQLTLENPIAGHAHWNQHSSFHPLSPVPVQKVVDCIALFRHRTSFGIVSFFSYSITGLADCWKVRYLKNPILLIPQ